MKRLEGKSALITGSARGIGRTFAEAYIREGATVAIADINFERAEHTASELGASAYALKIDVTDQTSIDQAIAAVDAKTGGIDILVNNAAHQMSFESLEEIPDEEWNKTFAVNISAMFFITKAALPHMKQGASIINTASINADVPNPSLLAYATTKGAIQNFTAGLAQLLAEKGIRANTVAPGPVWTPLIPASMPDEKVQQFGSQVPMKRPAQPCELAPVYVMLASSEASYVSGATVAVTGGKPIL